MEVPADEDESSDEEDSSMYNLRIQLDLFVFKMLFWCLPILVSYCNLCHFSYLILLL